MPKVGPDKSDWRLLNEIIEREKEREGEQEFSGLRPPRKII